MRSRRRRWLAATLISAGVAVSLVALEDPFSAGARPTAQGATPPQAVGSSPQAPVSTRFALLREPAGPLMPAAIVKAASHAPTSYGLALDQARESADGTWLIPGVEGTCIALHDDEGIGMRCADNAAVESGGLVFTVRDQGSGEERIVGAAPDGAASAVAENVEGSRLASVPVQENTYELDVRDPAKLEID